MAIITISRQMGSGGYTIAAGVAKALNYDYVDRLILMHAAHAHGVPEAALAAVAERRLTYWDRLDEEKQRYLTFLQAAYYAFAEKDNIVTAGRQAPALLRGVSHALRVRLIAPFEVRVERIMKKERLDHAAAAHKVRAYDREIGTRVAYLFGAEWASPENYDLVLNTEREDSQLYTDLVAAVARHPRFQPTPESLQRMQDLSLAAQVRAAIAKDSERRNISLEVTAAKGHIALKGTVRAPHQTEAVEAVAKRVPGVTGVSCEQVVMLPLPVSSV